MSEDRENEFSQCSCSIGALLVWKRVKNRQLSDQQAPFPKLIRNDLVEL